MKNLINFYCGLIYTGHVDDMTPCVNSLVAGRTLHAMSAKITLIFHFSSTVIASSCDPVWLSSHVAPFIWKAWQELLLYRVKGG